MQTHFDYNFAFSRNLGWITESELESLKTYHVAIAGLGGVGGHHLTSLVRLGVGKFNISDLDVFELVNFNRQAGASLSHLGHPKVEVMKNLALDINPSLEIKIFPEGVNADNIDEFLAGVDLYVDALDFFAVKARQIVFAACAEKGIPAITAAPIGMGVSFLCFMPGEMTFEEYFRWEGQTENEQLLRFLIGLSPTRLQLTYLKDNTRFDLAQHKGPSTPMACYFCAGMVGAYALKILLHRGEIISAPRAVHFDGYLNKSLITWRPWGNLNPFQQLNLWLLRKKFSSNLNN